MFSFLLDIVEVVENEYSRKDVTSFISHGTDCLRLPSDLLAAITSRKRKRDDHASASDEENT
ncbi:hypothetical protein JVU11DRAFT_6529 [Chiua virens]|nr:hypothetical protein JVU11DRAFT_6529 [Chiua virens]